MSKTRPPIPRANLPASKQLANGVDGKTSIKTLGRNMSMKYTPRRMTPVVVSTTPVEMSDAAIRRKVTKFVDALHAANGLPPASFYPKNLENLQESPNAAFLEKKREELESILHKLDQLSPSPTRPTATSPTRRVIPFSDASAVVSQHSPSLDDSMVTYPGSPERARPNQSDSSWKPPPSNHPSHPGDHHLLLQLHRHPPHPHLSSSDPHLSSSYDPRLSSSNLQPSNGTDFRARVREGAYTAKEAWTPRESQRDRLSSRPETPQSPWLVNFLSESSSLCLLYVCTYRCSGGCYMPTRIFIVCQLLILQQHAVLMDEGERERRSEDERDRLLSLALQAASHPLSPSLPLSLSLPPATLPPEHRHQPRTLSPPLLSFPGPSPTTLANRPTVKDGAVFRN
eukprot:3357147-Rhodomonas_salina.1